MQRIVRGASDGVAFGSIDRAMIVFGNHPEHPTTMLLAVLPTRLAIGLRLLSTRTPALSALTSFSAESLVGPQKPGAAGFEAIGQSLLRSRRWRSGG
ncbi:MAG TPA: hypothetical protein VKH45_04635 [Candidatus Acidoferrum sp.]|nr:hypothetical protein [Candidatus Acidoferrum sp.]